MRALAVNWQRRTMLLVVIASGLHVSLWQMQSKQPCAAAEKSNSTGSSIVPPAVARARPPQLPVPRREVFLLAASFIDTVVQYKFGKLAKTAFKKCHGNHLAKLGLPVSLKAPSSTELCTSSGRLY